MTAPIAAVTRYQESFIPAFEVNQTILRATVSTEGVQNGYTFTFLVAGRGSNSATTRDIYGKIIYGQPSETQVPCTLQQWHAANEMQGFNMFASQGGDMNQQNIMRMASIGAINDKIDQQIISALDTGSLTINAGVAGVPDIAMWRKATTKLFRAKVKADNNLTALITPGFHSYMMDWPQFSNKDYVELRPQVDMGAMWNDTIKVYVWNMFKIIVHPELPDAAGDATNETNYFYTKTAVGHAMDTKGMQVDADYDRKEDTSWCRATFYGNGIKLQNAGIIKVQTDTSAYT